MLAEFRHSYHVTNRLRSGESFKREKRALQADEKAVLWVEQQINYRSKAYGPTSKQGYLPHL